MIISFCFTIKILNTESELDRYIELIDKAIMCAKEHHKVRFYTDSETIKYISQNDIEIKYVDTYEFYFIDDFKIYLLDKLEQDEILIDVDLFLFAPLKINNMADLNVDFKDDTTNKEWYTKYLNWCVENGIKKILPTFDEKIKFVPNIGILKIKNKQLLNDYQNLYYKVRRWILSKDDKINKQISIILGQYLLGILMCDYIVEYCYTNKNHYVHLSGMTKFEKNIIKDIKPISNKKLI